MSQETIESPVGGSGSSSGALSTPRMQGSSFECYHCLKKIDPGKPVYMRHDFPFCSKPCRQEGIAPLYRLLLSKNPEAVDQRLSSAIRERTSSVSSLASDQSPAVTVSATIVAQTRHILQRIVRTASTTAVGSSIFRTYSSSLDWGRNVTRNTSFNSLFDYLPDIEGLINNRTL